MLILQEKEEKIMELMEIGRRARDTEPLMRKLPTAKKNSLLLQCAKDLQAHAAEIIAANALDMEQGRQNGMAAGLLEMCIRDRS